MISNVMNDSGLIWSQFPASLLRLRLDCGWREMGQGEGEMGESEGVRERVIM